MLRTPLYSGCILLKIEIFKPDKKKIKYIPVSFSNPRIVSSLNPSVSVDMAENNIIELITNLSEQTLIIYNGITIYIGSTFQTREVHSNC